MEGKLVCLEAVELWLQGIVIPKFGSFCLRK